MFRILKRFDRKVVEVTLTFSKAKNKNMLNIPMIQFCLKVVKNKINVM